MKTTQVRHSVFETNSSSTHSLTIGKGKAQLPDLDEGNILRIETGEYGWEQESYSSPNSRLSYVFTYVMNGAFDKLKYVVDVVKKETNAAAIFINDVNVDDLIGKTEAELALVKTDRSYYDWGYIDHQSIGDDGPAGLNISNEDDLRNFLFNESSSFETDNDNH